MKILFLCSCLEAEKDGVGDYARLLAAACSELNHECALVALNDSHIKDWQEATEGKLSLIRYSQWLTNPEHFEHFEKKLAKFQPDYISLQLVGYGYQAKGFVTPLTQRLKQLKTTARWHIMFHEIWIGPQLKAHWKERVVGWLQRRCLQKLVATIKPTISHTHAPAYQHLLKEAGIRTSLLPLFGNIPIYENGNIQEVYSKYNHCGVHIDEASRGDFWLFGIFGTLHPQWPPQPLLYYLQNAAERSGKKIVLISFGKDASGQTLWDSLATENLAAVSFVRLGPLPTEQTSLVMQNLDFGIATSPLSIIEKSGSVAALHEHGIPILINRDNIAFRNFDHHAKELLPGYHLVDDQLPDRLTQLEKPKRQSRIPEIAQQFLQSLK